MRRLHVHLDPREVACLKMYFIPGAEAGKIYLLRAARLSLETMTRDPMDCSPSGSSVHEDSPGKNT